MKRLVALILVAALWPALPAGADVAAGSRAYRAGDYEAALRELLPLALQGEAEAQYLIGVMRNHGQGVRRDYVAAASWYELAARQGHVGAQFNLGFLYYTGTGEDDFGHALRRDYGVAARWLARAAEAGAPMAQYLIGSMYLEGQGVDQDSVAAAKWILLAAEAGIGGAQYDAGLILAEGRGVRPDKVEAYKWFAILAEEGYPGAASNRQALAAVMTADQIARAEDRARDWRARRAR